jgi:hypothetical protein
MFAVSRSEVMFTVVAVVCMIDLTVTEVTFMSSVSIHRREK